jgi:hypothetical protein
VEATSQAIGPRYRRPVVSSDPLGSGELWGVVECAGDVVRLGRIYSTVIHSPPHSLWTAGNAVGRGAKQDTPRC